jgi:hypothetical protein
VTVVIADLSKTKTEFMYCIRKFADCWALFDLDADKSRRLTEAEVEVLRREVPALDDPTLAAYYTDRVDCIIKKQENDHRKAF